MKGWTSSTPAVRRAKLKPKRRASHLETKFERLWYACRVPGQAVLIREYIFHPPRKWRFDFVASDQSKIAFEIEGGIWTKGRHGRGKGMTEDAIKYLEAALLGWTVIRLVDSQITTPVIQRLIKFVEEKK